MAVEIQAANRLVASEKWSHDVHTKRHPPEGKFADGSAESIAEWAERSHNGNIGKAIQSISFYLNRGGKNLSDEQKSKVEHAKGILERKHAKAGGEHKKD